jgi:hypothetical protein
MIESNIIMLVRWEAFLQLRSSTAEHCGDMSGIHMYWSVFFFGSVCYT